MIVLNRFYGFAGQRGGEIVIEKKEKTNQPTS